MAPSPTEERGSLVLLPPKLKPGKHEHTYVEETIKPAVTHELIRHEKTEIVREEISKEVHVHHYFTYTQPIKTVEILPARHFMIDSETGEKFEIPPPEGWSMPPQLRPYTPDLSGLATETRHYLVNDQYPKGIPEAAPDTAPPQPQKRSSQRELSKKPSVSASWTPFPKTR
jgi:hypothetical protein